MTLREMLGSDVHRIQDQIDDLLDRADGLIVLFDGSRMVTYPHGFGVSPCQLELLSVEVERAARTSSADSHQRTGGIGGTVRKASKETIMALALAFFSLWIVLAVGLTAVWLTAEVRVFGLVMLPTAIVAGLLVGYFDWRAKLRRRVLGERDTHRKVA